MNEELQALYQHDQADRRDGLVEGAQERDRQRRLRVAEILAEGTLQTAEDYFHAAMIFQHGEQLEDYWQAHEFAKKAADLGHLAGRWLTAASYDRWLMKQGKPQKYGTQYISIGGGPMRLWDLDPSTTDEERAALGVPPLARILQRGEEKAGEWEQRKS